MNKRLYHNPSGQAPVKLFSIGITSWDKTLNSKR